MRVPPAAMAVDLKPIGESTDLALAVREVDGPIFLFCPTYTV